MYIGNLVAHQSLAWLENSLGLSNEEFAGYAKVTISMAKVMIT